MLIVCTQTHACTHTRVNKASSNEFHWLTVFLQSEDYIRTMSLASEAESFSDPAGHSQGRELKAKNGSNFLPRLACEETKEDEFNEALCL